MSRLEELFEAYKEHIDKNPSEIPMFRQCAIIEAGFTEIIGELKEIQKLLKKKPAKPAPKADK